MNKAGHDRDTKASRDHVGQCVPGHKSCIPASSLLSTLVYSEGML